MIQKIKIHNFRGIQTEEIHPKHLNVLIGPNGTGKSSTLDAIRFALTGKYDGEPILAGAENAEAAILFDDGNWIERSIGGKGSIARVNGKRVTQHNLALYITEITGMSPELLEAYLTSDLMSSMDKKALTSLFFSVLPLTASRKAVLEMAEAIKGVSLLEEERTLFEETFKPNGITIDDLNAGYRALYKRRSEMAGALKILIAKTAEEPKKPEKSAEQIRARLSEIAKAEAETKAYQTALSRYEKAEADYQEKQKEAAALKKQADGIQAEKPNDDAYRQNRSDRKRFEDAIAKYSGAVSAIEANSKMLRKMLGELNSSVCPISKKLVCATDKSGIRKETEETIAHNDHEVQKGNAFIRKCREQVTRLDVELEEYTKNSRRYAQKNAILMKIDVLTKLAKPEKPKKPDEKLLEKPGEKEKLNQMLSATVLCENFRKNMENLKKAKRTHEALDFAVHALNPKSGIANQILAKVVTNLENLCNQKADLLRKGFRIRIRIDEGVEIYFCAREGANFVPMDSASSGEKILIQYLLITALNAVTGAKLLILDSLDRLDQNTMKAFLELLRGDASIEHIFCGTVDHIDTMELLKRQSDLQLIQTRK